MLRFYPLEIFYCLYCTMSSESNDALKKFSTFVNRLCINTDEQVVPRDSSNKPRILKISPILLAEIISM